MTPLRSYSANEVRELADATCRELKRAPDAERQERLEEFKFRSRGGAYGAICLADQHWHEARAGTWLPVEIPSCILEGPASFATPAMLAARDLAPAHPSNPDIGVLTGPTALAAIVLSIREKYATGRITSSSANELATANYLLDRQGGIWTIGFWSASWYRHERGNWRIEPEPPAQESLVTEEVRPGYCAACSAANPTGTACRKCGINLQAAEERIAAGIADFLTADELVLPEEVADPWSPPPGYPDGTVVSARCFNPKCGAELKPNAKFCAKCGTPAGPAAAVNSGESICPSPACGKRVPAGKRFCAACGTRII